MGGSYSSVHHMSLFRDADGSVFNAVLLDGPTLINGPAGEACVPAGWYLIEPAPIIGKVVWPVGVTPETFELLVKEPL